MYSLVRVRWLQLKYQARAAGLLYSAAATALLILLAAAIYKQYTLPGRGLYISLALVLTVLSIHATRNDYAFVRRQVSRPVLNVFMEYACLSLPFTIVVLFTRHWWHFFPLQACFAGIAALQLPSGQRTALPRLSRFIPPTDFEWLSGIRKGYRALLPLFVLSWLCVPFRIAPLIPLWLLMAGIVSFYQECESRQVLQSSGQDARPLLRLKILRHTRLLALVMAPQLLINALFNPGMAWISLVFIVLQVIVLVFAIVLKYTTYEPGAVQQGTSVLLGLAVLSAALPFLTPVPLLLGIRYYPKAIRNLQLFLT